MDVLTLDDGDFRGKRVLVRVDFNVPLDGDRVTDDARIRAAMPTIDRLRDAGARVILCSHLGRPDGQRVPALSLERVADHIEGRLGVPCRFVPECIGPAAEAATKALGDSDILLLENLRFHAEETANDPDFAAALASLADVYVNDAFGTAHRAHASTAGVAEHLPAYAGLLIEKEIRLLRGALEAPERPFVAILGGAKVSDKIGVIEALLGKADRIIIGGAMAFTFLKAQGEPVGASRVEEDKIELAGRLLGRAREQGVEVLLPEDVIAADAFEAATDHRAATLDAMLPEWMGLDIGPLTRARFVRCIKDAGTILWNGPMGVFEWEAFQVGTRQVAKAVAANKGTTIVGGGDSAAAAKQFKIADRVTHVSTGGGASLAMLEGQTLPGIAALEAARARVEAVA